MTEKDRMDVLSMMQIFYRSPAVLSDGSDEIYNSDIDNCVNSSPYLEGYIFEAPDAIGGLNTKPNIAGYAMIAKSFSTEFGKPCIWIEDLYIKEEYRGYGIGSRFFDELGHQYPNHLFRLEVEEDNERAVHVYDKNGFVRLPYVEMVKHN
jgi:ribosomal protein S18 acetylase RimI-like enzyme